ncbi:hypothetical protein E4L96_19940 [Massilia arenosa]|uniref:Uncharacterized protein n=1 Tax=Zemynaea arenosa TaxID=2561931 RepID=A0A4Y9RYQ8_9BURK|nr:hypothetical protein [Massilia arenosa]TFW13371.1 hypothetical protein E4L96_19940 [Massilia arenosa]
MDMLFYPSRRRPTWLRPLYVHHSRAVPKIDSTNIDDTPLNVDWTEEEVIYLHWRLLREIANLARPTASLECKIETLSWIFTDAEHDSRPFSFASCLRVVSLSPLSPIAYLGPIDVERVRDSIRHQVSRWLCDELDAYPDWMRAAVIETPSWVANKLDTDPRCLSRLVNQAEVQPDLFTESGR